MGLLVSERRLEILVSFNFFLAKKLGKKIYEKKIKRNLKKNQQKVQSDILLLSTALFKSVSNL